MWLIFQGRQFDGSGNLVPWWTEETLQVKEKNYLSLVTGDHFINKVFVLGLHCESPVFH